MKNTIKIAVVLLITASMAYAGARCIMCNGSGWKGPYRCSSCGGDGEVGN